MIDIFDSKGLYFKDYDMIDTDPDGGKGNRRRKFGQKQTRGGFKSNHKTSYDPKTAIRGVSGRYTKLAAKEKNFLKSVTIKRDSYDGLPEKIQKLFLEKIREYQLNNEEFLISDIDKITNEISNGKQKELNYSKYGFNSKQECIESLCVSMDEGIVTFEDDDMNLGMSEYESLLELIESKIESFGNELSIADFKQECKTAGIGKNVKEALKIGGFGSLKDYFDWISKTVEGFEFDQDLEVLTLVENDGSDESDYESAVETSCQNGDISINFLQNLIFTSFYG